MNHFINPYNPVMNFLGKLLDCILLNLLWILCSLPVLSGCCPNLWRQMFSLIWSRKTSTN